MYYCQDCGAANGADAASCRICGHYLVRERGGAPCHACGGPTVVDGKFCSLCGSAFTVTRSSAPEPVVAAARADVVVASPGPTASAGATVPITLGEGLDLPDWLKRAASEQPFDPGQQAAIGANPFGPPVGSTATLARSASAQPVLGAPVTVAAVRAAESFDVPSHAPLSLPVDGLGSAPPSPQQPPMDGGGPTGEPMVARASNSDVADTSSFISENDLPEWIRQLAAADEAKKAEEMRQAAEAARADLKGPEGESRRRRLLPGETEDSSPATSPWLVRRERTDAAETVAADSWGSAAAAGAASAPERASSNQMADFARSVSEESAESPVAVEQHSSAVSKASSVRPNQMRLVLLVAAALAVLAVVVFLAI